VPGPPDQHTDLPDSTLLTRAQQGDEQAFTTLYLRHRDFVHRLARRLAPDDAAAMDITQDAFTYLLKALPRLRLTGRLSTYLYPIVKSLAATHGRDRQRRLRLARDLELSPTPPPAAPHTDHAPLLAAVNALPEPQREVLLMRTVDEMTVEEVATALSIPPGTVKSRLHHALSALRANLSPLAPP
jgi:RNA polymerase sigma-70 factor (ECF subfamily)